ncbi:MAG: hypothetical protein V3V57_01730 [Spirochaetia bacterium]|jgi:hypothetical protein
MKDPDLLRAVKPIVQGFDELAIPYYIGGSIASSVYGMARSTIDVDLVADIESRHIMALMDRLEKNYYMDDTAIADAIKRGSSFNLIHLETSIKIDVFIPRDEIYHHTAMDRRHRDTLFDENMITEFYFCSPEDIIINKLQWYVSGGEVSERQWLDVSGVIKVQAESLDTTYLLRWSKDLGLHELLVRAFEEAGVHLQP